MSTLIDKVVGQIDDKRRWRAYKARVRALPAAHRTAAEGLERYTSHLGVLTGGDLPADGLMPMLEEVVGRLESAADAGASVASVVGADPVAFADDLVETHLGGRWASAPASTAAIEREFHAQVDRGLAKERDRLRGAVGQGLGREGAR
ncbi:DUF1048 domain-containing protein [Cellulomonas sp. APG4]|uniref:DUF1048 domain-containing protein n=1 Tax=Cellulomonas sp. APG4 TaxID=1538656 RepID=UPI00137AC337|nr:DUF1048 domain-containing protein [Cellulomonas sp. APG4]NCT90415.1 DUF1048 domain-containing protein [Cellulomonas sp. APG4]